MPDSIVLEGEFTGSASRVPPSGVDNCSIGETPQLSSDTFKGNADIEWKRK